VHDHGGLFLTKADGEKVMAEMPASAACRHFLQCASPLRICMAGKAYSEIRRIGII
jgi:hypothetical protein